MPDLTPEKLAELRADIAALPEGMHHPHWSGNTDNPGHMELSAWVPGWGRTSLMRPTRWGMQGAKFQFLNPDTVMMEDADRLVKFEVGNPNVTGAHRRDGSVYRGNIAGIDHPVARLIVAALEYIPALLDAAAERDALAEWRDFSVAELEALRATLEGRCLSDITHRDEEHRQSVCMLPEGHAPLMHDDCMGCTWTDADHWQQSAVDRADELEAAIERVRALHQACTCEVCGEDPSCEACDSMTYPCATIRALDESETVHEG